MGQYRESRSLEASILDYLSAQLTADGWSGIRVEKSFANVYNGSLPCICVNILDTTLTQKEIGNYQNLRFSLVNIRIFATSDGQRLDLADWLVEKLETGFDYYEYVIVSGVVSSKTKTGRVSIRRFSDNRKELVNTENLEVEDRFRHLISVEMFVAK